MIKRILTPLLLCTIFCFAQDKQNITNVLVYSGEFNYGNYSTDIKVEIHQNKTHPNVFFTSIGQNAFQIPARKVLIDNDSLHFVLQSDYYTYQFKGKVTNDLLSLKLTVDNVSQRVDLTKTFVSDQPIHHKKDIELNSQGLKLFGTLYFPAKSNGKAIYFVTSSGNNDRSASRAETIRFAQQGYITFHIDKRGTGQSEGNWQSAEMESLCADDIEAIQYLSKTAKIPLSAIGIKGSSQGAAKVPYILNQLKGLSFGIAVSCPGSSLLESDINYWKNNHAQSIGETDINEATALQKMVYEFIAGTINRNTLNAALDRKRYESWFSQIWVPELDQSQIDKKLNYSPMPYFEKIKQPILLIQGMSDLIIPQNSYQVISKALGDANAKTEIIVLENANHSMNDQSPSDFPYWSSLHPDYLTIMFTWMDHLDK